MNQAAVQTALVKGRKESSVKSAEREDPQLDINVFKRNKK